MSEKRTGYFLGLPYDWRVPTWARFASRVWNPADRRLLTPKDFGWGYTVNLYEAARRLLLLRQQ